MTRQSYNIDLTKPVFPFGQEYWPNKAEPVSIARTRDLGTNIRVMEIKNALPTTFGHSSFFSKALLAIQKLLLLTERLFTYQDSLGNNTLIALGKYGAMFSTDGVTWDMTEVPMHTVQATDGKYEYTPIYRTGTDTEVPLIGFVEVTATVAVLDDYVGATLTNVAAASITNEKLLEVVVIPVDAAGQYNALTVNVPYDESYMFNTLVDFLDPGLARVIEGYSYVFSNAVTHSTHTAVAGDTVTSVLNSLVNGINATNEGVLAEYINDNKIKVSALSAHSTTAMEYSTIFEVPPAFGGATNLITLNNDQVPVSIPAASVGNLGYVIFNSSTGDLTDGDFNIRRSGMYQVGGSAIPQGNAAAPANDGSLYYTDINALLGIPYTFPLTELDYALRQFSGATQTGLTADIYDTGIPLTTIHLGSRSPATLQRINCELTQADIITGRVFILQSKGQLGSYTALAGDTLFNVLTGVKDAYNLGGSAVATLIANSQQITSTATDELFFQPGSLATMTASTSNTEYLAITDFTLVNNFVGSSEFRALYSLEFNTTIPSTNIIYTIYADGSPVPVTSPTGAWTNANYEFTSVQIAAAAAAGTKLMVRLNAKHLVIIPKSGGAGSVIGGYGFRFRAITANGANMSRHIGDTIYNVTMNMPIGVTRADAYTYNAITQAYTYFGIVDLSVSVFNPYLEQPTSIGNVVTLGNSVSTVSDVYKFMAPIDNTGYIKGNFKDLRATANPHRSSSVTFVVTNPITLASERSFNTFNLPYDMAHLTAMTVTELTTHGVFDPWSVAVIKNSLYCYRNNHGTGDYVLNLLPDGSAWQKILPNFANMAQIQGICAARGRLLMWDSANAVYTSSILDLADFTPALRTRANVTKIDSLIGDIVMVLPMGEGYIIYSTASIIKATYIGGTNLFKYSVISNTQGILNALGVVTAGKDAHYAITGSGLQAIDATGMREVSAELSEYILNSKLSPRVDYLMDRYVTIALSAQTAVNKQSHVEYYPGSVISGYKGRPGKADQIVPAIHIPAVVIPDVVIGAHSATPDIVIPDIVVPPITIDRDPTLYPDVVIPPVTIPAIAAGPNITTPDITIPGYTIPAIIIPPVTVPRLPVPTPDVPVYEGVPLAHIFYTGLAPYDIAPAGGVVSLNPWIRLDADDNIIQEGTYIYPNTHIETWEDLMAHYAQHVQEGIYADSGTAYYAIRDSHGLFIHYDPNDRLKPKPGASGATVIEPAPAATILSIEVNIVTGSSLDAVTNTIAAKSADYMIAQYLNANRYVDVFGDFSVALVDANISADLNTGLISGSVSVALNIGTSIVNLTPQYITGYITNLPPSSTEVVTSQATDTAAGEVTITVAGYTIPDIVVPEKIIKGVTIPGTSTIPASTIPGYTLPGYTITHAMRIEGYTIPGYTIKGIPMDPGTLVPGYTLPAIDIPEYTIQGYPSIPTVPDTVIPGGSFIANLGTSQPVGPVYNRTLLLDTHLKNWGSFDGIHSMLWDFVPINTRAFNPITGVTSTKFTYQNLAMSLGILGERGDLFLATAKQTDSYIEFGDIGYTRTGVTRFLDAMVQFTQETGATVQVLGSRDGVSINQLLITSDTSHMSQARINKVLTGKWFRVRVYGQFEMKGLTFSGEAGGKR